MADIYVSPDLLVGSVTQYGTPVSTQTHLTMEADSAFSAGSIQHNPTIIAEAVPTPVTVSADLLPAVADQYGTPISTQTHLIMEASAAQPAKAVQYEPTISVKVNASGDAGVTPAAFSASAVQYDPTISTTSAVAVTVSADPLVGNAAQAATFDGCDLTLGLDQFVGGGVLCTPTIITLVFKNAIVDADLLAGGARLDEPTESTIRIVTIAVDSLVASGGQRECTPIILWAVGAMSIRSTWLKPNLTFTATKPDIEYSESRPEVTFTGRK